MTKISKKLQSKAKMLVRALRHDPSVLNLKLDESGMALRMDVLVALDISPTELDAIIDADDKGRMRYDSPDLKKYVMATNGHSSSVVNQTEVEAASELISSDYYTAIYHGTSYDNLQSIIETGILPMKRTHVQLSASRSVAEKRARTVANKTGGEPIVLEVKMDLNANYRFFTTINGVIICRRISPAAIIACTLVESGRYLDFSSDIEVSFNSSQAVRHDVIVNKIITPDGTVLKSNGPNDYASHTDANGELYSIDGGTEPVRRKSANLVQPTRVLLTDESAHFIVREHFEVHGTRLSQLDTAAILLLLAEDESLCADDILSEDSVDMEDKHFRLLLRELEYRKAQGLL